jgi:uncharacterized membrane protein
MSARRHGALSGLALGAVIGAGVFTASATPALADLRMCNRTPSTVNVAVGRKIDNQWATEGWWNLPANSCHTLIEGNLTSRYYYLYAVDAVRGDDWSGKVFMCTQDRMFTIPGIEDCLKRGFDRKGFFEIDTGDQRSWTVQLTDSSRNSAGAAVTR